MSKGELKAALSGLQVNRPLKVPSAPAFRAPAFRAPDPVPSQVQSEPRVENEPRKAMPTQDEKAPGVQNEPRIERTNGPRAATPQDDAVVMQRELHSKLATGFTRVPNSLLMSMVSGDLGKNEIRLLLLIARLTISFDREYVKLSKTVVHRYTGMQGRAMLDAFAVLEERKLIRKITGDHKSPNQYALNAELNHPTPGSKRTEVQNEAQGQKHTQRLGQNEPPRKDNLEIYKNSLSQHPEEIREYFARPMPSRKRESEWRAFQELLGDYSTADVCAALVHLQSRRAGNGTDALIYHSPMAYLAKAMAEVMPQVSLQRERAKAHAERGQRDLEAQRQRQQQEAQEVALMAAQERAFHKVFTTDVRRSEIISSLLRGTPFQASSRPGRILAIGKWWDGLTEQEQKELIA